MVMMHTNNMIFLPYPGPYEIFNSIEKILSQKNLVFSVRIIEFFNGVWINLDQNCLWSSKDIDPKPEGITGECLMEIEMGIN